MLIKCPKCEKEINDDVKECPHCGNHLEVKSKRKFNKKVFFILAICIIAIVICGIIVRKNKIKQEELRQYQEQLQQYQLPLQCYNQIAEYYGDNIELQDAYYAYFEDVGNDVNLEVTTDYSPGRYVYLEYNMNPQGAEQVDYFVFCEGELLFNKQFSSSDPFSSFNVTSQNLLKQQFQLVLMSMLLKPQLEISQINDNNVGWCPLDIEFLQNNQIAN